MCSKTRAPPHIHRARALRRGGARVHGQLLTHEDAGLLSCCHASARVAIALSLLCVHTRAQLRRRQSGAYVGV